MDSSVVKAEKDRRLEGLDFAIYIADHWHQRFLTLRSDQGVDGVTSFASLDALQYKAEGAKQVLDDIRAERAYLAALPQSAASGGDTLTPAGG